MKWFLKTLIKSLTVTVIAISIAAPASASGQMALKDIISATMNNNPQIIEYQKRSEEKTSKITVAQSLANPQIGVMFDDIPTGTANPFNGMMYEYNFVQDIMNPSKLRLMGKMASSEAAMAEKEYQDKRLAAYIEAKQGYYDLLFATKALEIGKENQQFMGQLAQIAQVNYSTGMVPLQDTLRAQTEYSKMTTDLVNMAAMVAVAKAKLNVIMGRAADADYAVTEEFVAPPPNFDLAALQSSALSGKPALQAMQSQVEMAQSGVTLAKKEGVVPDFQVTLGYKDSKAEMGMNTWKIEVMAMIPLWQGKNKAGVMAATKNLEASQAALSNMKNMTGLDVQMALVEGQSAWRQIDLYKNTIIPQADQSYQAAVVAYTNGKADFMAVLDALTASRNAKLDYYKARVNYEKAAANLEKAVGKPLFGQY